MRILILNWRDIKNPKAGGAEILTHAISRLWVKEGHQVTWLTSIYSKSIKKEEIDNIQIIRMGKALSSQIIQAFIYLIKKQENYDLIIDQIHWLPFFTPLYIKTPLISLIYENPNGLWGYHLPKALEHLAEFITTKYLKVYKNTPFITLSQFTKKELEKQGIKNVYLFPPGINFPKTNTEISKTKNPSILIISRLVPHKRIEDIIIAFKKVSEKNPKCKLWIVGKGKLKYEIKLKKITEKLNLKDKVFFCGYINEKEKIKRLQESWIIINTSKKEGWGLNIVEAGICQTPAVVYNTPGLNEAVIHNQTGLICSENNPFNLAENINKILKDNYLRKKLGEEAKKFNQQFTWERSAKISLNVLQNITLQRTNY